MSGVVGASNYGGQGSRDFNSGGKYGSMDNRTKNSNSGYTANSTSY